VTDIRTHRLTLAVLAGGIVGGLLLGWIHVFVLGYMALFTVSGYKYLGPWAFFLNGTASALLTAVILGIPLGLLMPRFAVRLALAIGAVAAVFLMYFGVLSATDRWSWVPVTDALQLPLLFTLGAWVGCLRVPRHART
jgi:hypothetical protein